MSDPVPLFVLAVLLGIVVADVPGGNFVTLRAHCHSDRINVSLVTSEAFGGLLYSRNHPSTCRSTGNPYGPPPFETWLAMTPDRRCGIRAGPDGGGSREVDVYVQHDPIFQQVIDEQFLVRCPAGAYGGQEGLVSYQTPRRGGGGHSNAGAVRDVTVTSKFGSSSRTKKERRIVEGGGGHGYGDVSRRGVAAGDVIQSNLVGSDVDVVAEAPVWVEKKKRGQEELHQAQQVPEEAPAPPPPEEEEAADPGWLELSWPDSDASDLREGDPVDLVARLRPAEGRDEAMGACEAFGEDPSSARIRLTGSDGCPAGPGGAAFPGFAESYNRRTGVKTLASRFPAPRPGPSGRLRVRCRVLVCLKSCPTTRCKEGNNRAGEGVIVGGYWLRTHAEVAPAAARPRAATELPGTRSAHLRREELEEAEEAYLEKQLLDEEERRHDHHLMCVSPSRLVAAFAVLLLVLLLALVCACLLWARARAVSTSAGSVAGGAPVSPTPSPRLVKSMALLPRPPGPPPQSPPRRVLLQQRGMPPYIRVVQ